ncbi:serine/threonine-protein kinase [Amnibacterium sp. CER49]|uniref:serine/threonine-protein kinase n=1 Tax=Amnibacterium sp. CER49 TaxID=3039161 RepID=UPI0024489628|nr:serine/threonine-protein kinase [Amnibacterium sp. CER49]MDH2444502.1 serine/threonine-protein kinase [Amnibacterium sp. CER49]
MEDDRRPGPGDVLDGRYHLLDRLGRGGMSDVFEAQDLVHGGDVAVKVYRRDVAEALDPSRTTREMQVLTDVAHPTLVQVLNASADPGSVPYLVLELVRGADLGALVHEQGPLEPERVRRIVADVADALAALHERGLVHRDVKPANILVRDGSDGLIGPSAKLTDFGITLEIGATRVTGTGTIVGTAAYLSPEQVRGATVGTASDVYALGLVLIEALTGERAYRGSLAESAVARLHRPPALPPTASPALAHLLSAMTALDPDQRPRAAQVRDRLDALVGAMTAEEAGLTGGLMVPAFLEPLPELEPQLTGFLPARSTRPAALRLLGAAAAVAVAITAGSALALGGVPAPTQGGAADAAAGAVAGGPTALPSPSSGAPSSIAAVPAVARTVSLRSATSTGPSAARSTSGRGTAAATAHTAPAKPKASSKGGTGKNKGSKGKGGHKGGGKKDKGHGEGHGKHHGERHGKHDGAGHAGHHAKHQPTTQHRHAAKTHPQQRHPARSAHRR